MDGILELDVLIYPDEVRLVSQDDIREWELETASQPSVPAARLFVALYPYNPAAMSPNHETAAEELPFVPGQIIKVFGDKDSDGFYHGESGGLWGDVPSNMVAEVPLEDENLKELLMQQGFLPVDRTECNVAAGTRAHGKGHLFIIEVIMWSMPTGVSFTPEDLSDTASIPDDVVVRRMVTIFEYDPWESSPNLDSEAELGFRAGDIIYVFGDMDQDGFYYVCSESPLDANTEEMSRAVLTRTRFPPEMGVSNSVHTTAWSQSGVVRDPWYR
ncbi:RIMS-binding protein 2 [Merluccius polli]|uniref:RIMS-binding protein 2 n=1 Tax=Merluccius polli TaxID=89951 RepID=A0AA47P2S4_MERPO|nr:RIMS-binding protein 2 [Merluccius polli]